MSDPNVIRRRLAECPDCHGPAIITYAPAIYDDPADHEGLICTQHESERHWWRHVIAESHVHSENIAWQIGSGFFHECYFNDLRRSEATPWNPKELRIKDARGYDVLATRKPT